MPRGPWVLSVMRRIDAPDLVSRATARATGRMMKVGSRVRKRAADAPDGAASTGWQAGSMNTPRVLVVDDEVDFAGLVAGYLDAEGFETEVVHDGLAAVEAAAVRHPDVAVLDLMLPGLDGLEVCRRLRESSDCYIVMLTARDGEADKVHALSIGADDYLVKPLSPRELIARIKAMMRRPRTTTKRDGRRLIEVGALVIDTEQRRVSADGVERALTRTEYAILLKLALRPAVAVSRRELVDAVWGPDWVGDDHILDVHVGNLRRKLEDSPARPRYVRTVRGIGYSLDATAARSSHET